LNEYFFIPENLELKLKKNYNISQFEALQCSIKKKGLTLIQGPPGTGKSTTILGILSVILNSVNKREFVCRYGSINDNGLGDSSDQDNFDNMNIFYKQHPWINNPQYSNVMDEPFVLNSNFFSYPKSIKTDNFREIKRHVDEDFVQPEKILVCAPSNIAIDEIVNKIIQFGLFDANGNRYNPKFVRIGPNYHPSVREYSLEYLINDKLSKEENKDVEKFKTEILTSVKIVCSTLSMAGSAVMTTLNQVKEAINN
jgi:senataxin